MRLLGVDRIGHFEHVILGYLKGVFGSVWPGSSSASGEEGKDKQEQVEGEGEEKAVEGGEILGADGIAKKEKAEEASTYITYPHPLFLGRKLGVGEGVSLVAQSCAC